MTLLQGQELEVEGRRKYCNHPWWPSFSPGFYRTFGQFSQHRGKPGLVEGPCSFRLGWHTMNLVRFELLDMLKSLTHLLLMSLAPGFPQRFEFSSHSKLIVSSSIYSVKAEVCEFWPSPARFGVFFNYFFLYFLKWKSKEINCPEKIKENKLILLLLLFKRISLF